MADRDYLIKESTLTGIADEIRVHTGGSKKIKPENMREEIFNVAQTNYSNGEAMGYTQGHSVGLFDGQKEINDLVDATSVTAGSVLEGTTFYKNGQTLTGTMPNNPIKIIYLNATTKKYTIPTGYHSSGGSVEIQTTTGSAKPYNFDNTYTPSSNHLYSSFTVKGDSDLKSENIKSGVSIFDVQGSYCPTKDYTFTNNGEYMYLIAIKPDGIGRENITDTDPYVINDWYPDGTVLSLIPGTMVYVCVAEGDVNKVEITREDAYNAYNFFCYGQVGGMQEGFFMLC